MPASSQVMRTAPSGQNAPITRAEFAAMAARFSDVEYDGGNSFSDVSDNYWAARYIALAEDPGLD